MSTSGTVGTTTISVMKLIEHGARRAGKLAEELTSEQIESAREALYYVLSNLANRGIQYWCIDRHVVGLTPFKAVYAMPVGVVDVLNSNYRTVARNKQNPSSSAGDVSQLFDGDLATSFQFTTNDGWVQINAGTGQNVMMTTVGILPSAAGSVTITIQASDDGVTWREVLAPGAETWVPGTWLWYDLQPTSSAPYWRVQQSLGVNMGMTELVFGSNPTEIPLSRMNRDDYANLPNKSFVNDRPLQFWFNRSIPQPSMHLWPVPSDAMPQVVAWCHRYVQDVGDLAGELEIPQRWYLAVQDMLAHQMALELPGVDPARIDLCKKNADEHWVQAEQEERDKSPIYLVPNIGVYTR